MAWGVRRGKFNAVPTFVNGIRFASGAEAARYGELLVLQRAGQIFDLELQPKFPLVVNGMLIANYIGDFQYWQGKRREVMVVEDVKGVKTPAYRLKKKLMHALHHIEIVEVTSRVRAGSRGRGKSGSKPRRAAPVRACG